MSFRRVCYVPRMVASTYNPSSWKAEAVESFVWGQSKLQGKIVSCKNLGLGFVLVDKALSRHAAGIGSVPGDHKIEEPGQHKTQGVFLNTVSFWCFNL